MNGTGAYNAIVGWALLIGGIALVIGSLGSLIFRLLVAYVGYMLINYALRMLGKPPVQWWLMRAFFPFGGGF